MKKIQINKTTNYEDRSFYFILLYRFFEYLAFNTKNIRIF